MARPICSNEFTQRPDREYYYLLPGKFKCYDYFVYITLFEWEG